MAVVEVDRMRVLVQTVVTVDVQMPDDVVLVPTGREVVCSDAAHVPVAQVVVVLKTSRNLSLLFPGVPQVIQLAPAWRERRGQMGPYAAVGADVCTQLQPVVGVGVVPPHDDLEVGPRLVHDPLCLGVDALLGLGHDVQEDLHLAGGVETGAVAPAVAAEIVVNLLDERVAGDRSGRGTADEQACHGRSSLDRI